nr:hypothetical protein Iba_chr02bCG3850 [Ipomoea batatas]
MGACIICTIKSDACTARLRMLDTIAVDPAAFPLMPGHIERITGTKALDKHICTYKQLPDTRQAITRNDLTSSDSRRPVGCHRSHEQKPKELLEKRVTVRSILRVPFTRKDRDESDNSLRGGCTALEVKKWSQRCAESRKELFRGYR